MELRDRISKLYSEYNSAVIGIENSVAHMKKRKSWLDIEQRRYERALAEFNNSVRTKIPRPLYSPPRYRSIPKARGRNTIPDNTDEMQVSP